MSVTGNSFGMVSGVSVQASGGSDQVYCANVANQGSDLTGVTNLIVTGNVGF